MPDALRIVPPVLEEVIEDEKEGNGMEIDSGNGRDSADTLAAGVQCLLQCLNPATAESGDGKSNLFLSLSTPASFPYFLVFIFIFYFSPLFVHPFPPWRLVSAAG